MFQNFDVRSSPATGASRIAALRAEMEKAGVDAFLVPHADEHQSEYLPASAERLAWLTGFTGSAGFCIVTASEAVLFVDGRYTLQAAQQTDGELFAIESLIDHPPSKWLGANATAGMKVGFDPWLVTIGQKKRFTRALERQGAALVPTANLVDRVWADRPAPPAMPVVQHPLIFAGRSAEDKLADLAGAISESGADFCVLSDTVSVAWAFNIRGGDVSHIPVALAYALIAANGRPVLFVDPARMEDDAAAALAVIADIAAPASLSTTLAAHAEGKRFLCDPALVASAIADCIIEAGGTIVEGRDPVALPRAVKNEAEIAGSRAAHLRDGVAVTRFLAWLDRQAAAQAGGGVGTIVLDEIAAASQLEQFRADTATAMNVELREIAFDTISGAGANGAIVHYRVTTRSNRPLAPGSLYLVDSGGQYEDGTTDITRTIAIGTPPKGAAQDFTLVLKGHIAIATARFPGGTRGLDIDAFARRALWDHGKDYAHGTGHGVGAYLSVHEGPASISRRGEEPLKPGMILSNEPGYYREGVYGIRIENLLLVRESDGPGEGFLDFETLTLAPIDRRLIDTTLLLPSEIAWLDAYHARVADMLSPHLEDADSAWLASACAPLRG
ncbi:MAG: aminopeptidase P family protein [Pseudomonadota bacterium]|nr:aminopeptidase P family protein [Pseudomonadota bacterium]